jgi:hypothetical protein
LYVTVRLFQHATTYWLLCCFAREHLDNRRGESTTIFEAPTIETSTTVAFDGEVAWLRLRRADFHSSVLYGWLCTIPSEAALMGIGREYC